MPGGLWYRFIDQQSAQPASFPSEGDNKQIPISEPKLALGVSLRPWMGYFGRVEILVDDSIHRDSHSKDIGQMTYTSHLVDLMNLPYQGS